MGERVTVYGPGGKVVESSDTRDVDEEREMLARIFRGFVSSSMDADNFLAIEEVRGGPSLPAKDRARRSSLVSFYQSAVARLNGAATLGELDALGTELSAEFAAIERPRPVDPPRGEPGRVAP